MERMVSCHMKMKEKLEFYNGRHVLVTGNTGFKGSWLCHILKMLGAQVVGYALEPPTKPSLYDLSNVGDICQSVIGDIRDFKTLKETFNQFQPEIVLHLAAQPIVRESYVHPRETYETNVMGTVNLLECCRLTSCVHSVLNVTTDKVYLNREWPWGYRENEELDGHDPYSNSKSCSELVTHSYVRSFFNAPESPAVSTARAGNVIGGGDFAVARIIPDCVRAAASKHPIVVRNPASIRPYQHVLEPLFAYLMIAARQIQDGSLASNYNIGPDDCDNRTTGELVDLFVKAWGDGTSWQRQSDGGPHEANILRLDCSKVKKMFGWRPRWHVEEAIAKTVEWSRTWLSGGDIVSCMNRQIMEYLEA